MGDRARPALFTIPAHRAFADALVAGLLAMHRDPMDLAQGMVLLPNSRAIRAVSDAFVRQSGGGLLLPRLVAIGDPDMGEQVGGALDPVGEDDPIPPAIAPMRRQMMLARMVQDAKPGTDAGQALLLGQALGAVLDQMQVERVQPGALRDGLALSEDLSHHWQTSLAMFEILIARWPEALARTGCIDLADRRNRLFDRLAARWAAHPPIGFAVVAGVATTAPAIAALLLRVAQMPSGMVVFAGLDQHMDADAWSAIGPFDPDPVTGRAAPGQESHPQYALKRLLHRMSATRDDVALWRWGSEHDARAVRARNISNAMLPPRLTSRWRDLKTADRSLSGRGGAGGRDAGRGSAGHRHRPARGAGDAGADCCAGDARPATGNARVGAFAPMGDRSRRFGGPALVTPVAGCAADRDGAGGGGTVRASAAAHSAQASAGDAGRGTAGLAGGRARPRPAVTRAASAGGGCAASTCCSKKSPTTDSRRCAMMFAYGGRRPARCWSRWKANLRRRTGWNRNWPLCARRRAFSPATRSGPGIRGALPPICSPRWKLPRRKARVRPIRARCQRFWIIC